MKASDYVRQYESFVGKQFDNKPTIMQASKTNFAFFGSNIDKEITTGFTGQNITLFQYMIGFITSLCKQHVGSLDRTSNRIFVRFDRISNSLEDEWLLWYGLTRTLITSIRPEVLTKYPPIYWQYDSYAKLVYEEGVAAFVADEILALNNKSRWYSLKTLPYLSSHIREYQRTTLKHDCLKPYYSNLFHIITEMERIKPYWDTYRELYKEPFFKRIKQTHLLEEAGEKLGYGSLPNKAFKEAVEFTKSLVITSRILGYDIINETLIDSNLLEDTLPKKVSYLLEAKIPKYNDLVNIARWFGIKSAPFPPVEQLKPNHVISNIARKPCPCGSGKEYKKCCGQE